MDLFPRLSTRAVKPLSLSDNPRDFENVAKQGLVTSFIVYLEPKDSRILFKRQEDQWPQNRLDNLRRLVQEAKICPFFSPNDVQWERMHRRLSRPPSRHLKNNDCRSGYVLDTVYLVKAGFTFGKRVVEPGHLHLYQTTAAPLLFFELPAESHHCNAKPSLVHRSFTPYDQMLYKRYVFHPHSAYVVPPGVRYVLVTVQKSIFQLDVVPTGSDIPFVVKDRASHTQFAQEDYTMPPPRHCPEEIPVIHESELMQWTTQWPTDSPPDAMPQWNTDPPPDTMPPPQWIPDAPPQWTPPTDSMPPPPPMPPPQWIPDPMPLMNLEDPVVQARPPSQPPLVQLPDFERLDELIAAPTAEIMSLSDFIEDFVNELEEPMDLTTPRCGWQKQKLAFTPLKALDLSVVNS